VAVEATPTSWAEALPRLTPEDVTFRRRAGPLVARLGRWGERIGSALPRAVAGLWPGGPAAATGPVLRLELSGADLDVRELLVDQFPIRVGRGEGCRLQLPSPAVSTEHAEMRVDGGEVVLLDLRSTNGTKRNGEPLTPLVPVVLVPGDLVEIGPFVLVPQGLTPAPGAALELRASPPVPRTPETLFLTSHPSDRWVRVRGGAGLVTWLRVPAGWIRASWSRAAELPARDGDVLDPMEEGAAQYLLVQTARALERETGQGLDLSGWLTPDEARRSASTDGLWLESEVWLRAGPSEVVTSLVFPVPELAPVVARAPADLAWPATVCVGGVRLTLSEWRGVEPGDALLPDVWWPTGFGQEDPSAPGDLGPAFVRVRRTWHAGRLLRSEAGVNLRLESTWLDTPGGEWLMAEEDALGAVTPSSLPVDDLELQVAIELDRFPVTLGELQRWREGEVLNLRQGPSDPVRLVMETGLQRRVLAEGRVVIVNDRLGIEILRVLTRVEDSTPPR
jgi:flagellar motor switch/type III secretory pathway protein FliN